MLFFRLPLYLLDIIILVLLALILVILITGGGILEIRPGHYVRVHQVLNPLLILYLLLIIRLASRKKIPFLGRPALEISRLSDRAAVLWDKIVDWFRKLAPEKARRILFMIIAISIVIKILNAWAYFGFFSGDDVEIHEMTFTQLFHWDWKAWNIRSPFYPMVFIYPFQFILHRAGAQDPWLLIFAGRLVVVAFSALNLMLVYKVARRIFSSLPVALLSAFFLAISKLHTAFASTELPRTVASFFILLSCWLLFSEKRIYANAILSGIFLAIGAAMRFSEVVFLAPAVLFLIVRRRFPQALVFGVVFVASLMAILGISDALYWKSPWFSLRNIVDFTLVKKMSTRGYETPLYYVLSFGIWGDFLTIALACFALRLRNRMVWLWAFLPLVMLSFLPHKEPRYLVPSIPFIGILAALSAWHLLEKVRGGKIETHLPKRVSSLFVAPLAFAFIPVLLAAKDNRFTFIAIPCLFLLGVLYLFLKFRFKRQAAGQGSGTHSIRLGVALFIAVFFMATLEIDGFRLRRTEAGVEMTRFLARQDDLRGVAIEEIWRAGGRLYLQRIPTLLNIDQRLLQNPDQFLQEVRAKEIQAIGLREEHVQSLRYDEILKSWGFSEVVLSKKKKLYQYRLFIRR